MKSWDHYKCQLHIRVLYVCTTLMLLMILSNTFVFVYSPHRFRHRMTPSDTEEDYLDRQKRVTSGGPVAKREISSENGMNCEDDCPSKSKSFGNDEDSIQLTGSWRIKKSDLWEYCLRAEDFCRRNDWGIKENGSREEKKEEVEELRKDCVVSGVGDGNGMKIPNISNVHEQWILDPFQDPPGGEFSIWVKRYRTLLEYRVDRDLIFVRVRNQYALPYDDLGAFSGTVYNGSYFYQYKSEKKIVKFDLATGTVIKEKHVEDGFPFTDENIFFRSDEYGLWLIYHQFVDNRIVWLRINPQTLDLLSKHNITSIRYPFTLTFVAFGKLYGVESSDKTATVSSLIDFYGRNDKNVSSPFNVTGVTNKVLYDWKSRHLYVDQSGTFFRYKIYFQCSNQSHSLVSS